MAIFYFRTSIVRAGHGKSAVASAAYQAAEKLRSERLGQSFSYTNKEEVIHSEILLPPNAPRDYLDRQTLWNAVEASQNRSNSRYARQFVIAVPNEWGNTDAINWCRKYLQQAFVEKGIVVDWALHNSRTGDSEKPDNLHIHVMTTVRGINPDGTWQTMEKKEYALDEDGNRIPEIDPKTGEQKVRRRNRNGHETTEKIWKRISVIRNTWNSHEQLTEWKKMWAEHCNQHLAPDQHIDYRSYLQRGLERLPQLHEGPDARAALARGEIYDVVKENRERRELNARLDSLEGTLEKIKSKFRIIKEKLLRTGGINYDQTGSNTQSRYYRGMHGSTEGASGVDAGFTRSGHAIGTESTVSRGPDRRTNGSDLRFTGTRRGISAVRKRLSDLVERNRALADRIGDFAERKLEIERCLGRIETVKEYRRHFNERTNQIRNILLGGMGRGANQSSGGGTVSGTLGKDKGTIPSDTDDFIRKVRTSVARTRFTISDSTAKRRNRETERERQDFTKNNQNEKRTQNRKRMG